MDMIIYLIIGVVAGGVVAFVLQNIVMKKKTAEVLANAEREGEQLKKTKSFRQRRNFLN